LESFDSDDTEQDCYKPKGFHSFAEELGFIYLLGIFVKARTTSPAGKDRNIRYRSGSGRDLLDTEDSIQGNVPNCLQVER
jgi:hypothetical protein